MNYEQKTHFIFEEIPQFNLTTNNRIIFNYSLISKLYKYLI